MRNRLPLLSTLDQKKAIAIANAINRYAAMEDWLGKAVVSKGGNSYVIDIEPEVATDIEKEYYFISVGARAMYDILKGGN